MDIHKIYHLPNDVRTVFAAWVSSDTVIAPAAKMYVEPRIGGAYHLFMNAEDSTPSNAGTFSIFQPEHRVVYDWEWYGDGEVTTIDVTFTAEGSGTRIDLTHSGFRHQKSHDMHDSGWDSYIAGLKAHLAG